MEPETVIEGFRLSTQQTRIWRLQQTDSGTPYRATCGIRMRGPLDPAALVSALRGLTARNEILRTSFPIFDGMALPVQVVDEPETAPQIPDIQEHDLTGLNDATRTAKVEAIYRDMANQAFDFTSSRLLHASLVALSATEHLLILCLPALCADAASLPILMRELIKAYAEQNGEDPTQYIDLSEWQHEMLETDNGKTGIEYWRNRDLPALTDSSIHFEKPHLGLDFAPGSVGIDVSPALAEKLAHLSHRLECDMPVVLQACWHVLFARVSEHRDVLVGTAFDGRRYRQMEECLGPFNRYLPVNIPMDKETLFAGVAEAIRNEMSQLFEWQDYFSWDCMPVGYSYPAVNSPYRFAPPPSAGTKAPPSRPAVSRQAYWPLCCEFIPLPASESANGVTFSIEHSYACMDRFKLKLTCSARPESLRLDLHYDSDLFDSNDVELLLRQYEVLLNSAADNPDACIGSLDVLTGDQLHQMLHAWNDTDADYPRDKVFPQLFEEQVRRTPDNCAVSMAIGCANSTGVVLGDKEIGYRELNARANRLAHYLQGLGIGADSIVGICVERSLEMVVGILGVLKAGGAYVPLDPTLPEERLSFMLNDAGATVLLTQEKLSINPAADNLTVVCLDKDWDAIAREPDDNPDAAALPNSLAYVIYTSGSTGRPKGVTIPHRGLMNYLTWCGQEYRIGEGSGTLVHSPLSFDLTVTGLLGPLLMGQRVVLMPEDATVDEIGAAIRAGKNFSLVKITPAHLELLRYQLPPEEAAGKVNAFIVGGEALLPESLAFWQEHAPNTRLINEYGPTETVVGCCIYDATGKSSLGHSVPIGSPIANTQLYILDADLNPAPVGIAGELYIAGDGLARGYLNRAALTAEKFVPNPYSAVRGARMYRTGDLARYLPDGNIDFLGRIDHQVKIRGYRIELGEIEATLAEHADVANAVVLAREDTADHKQLVAYVTANDRGAIDEFLLRDHLNRRLPAYMMPSAFVVLDALPLTANGKVDRNRLPAPDFAARDEYTTPRTPLEETIADIWAKVLGRERVGIFENFFEIGGDSIISIQVVAKANQAGLTITPRMMFQNQTIADLAAVCGTVAATTADPALAMEPIPLTPIQRWFFALDLAEPHHFNQAALLQVEANLTPEILEQAVAGLVVHHDALRLRFTRNGDERLQHYAALEEYANAFDIVDLSGYEDSEQQAALEQSASALQAGFDLFAGPLFRARYFHFGPGKAGRLLLVAHHLTIDGVSWRILLEDLQTACDLLSAGQPVVLPNKTTSFQHWSRLLREHAVSGAMQTETTYWASLPWDNIKALPVDFDGGLSGNTTDTEQSVAEFLSAEQTEKLLSRVPEAYHTQINDILLAALAATLCRWAGCKTMPVALEGHGREDLFENADVSRTVGWFTSLFPIFPRWAPETSLEELLISTKEMLRTVPNHGIGYGLLRYLTEDSPLPQVEPPVSFNYLGQFDRTLSHDGAFRAAPEAEGPAHGSVNRRPYLLSIGAAVAGGRLRVNWSFSDRVHRRETVAALARDYREQLEALIDHCLTPGVGSFTPSDFPDARLSRTELRGILSNLGDAEVEAIYPLSPMQQGMLFHSLYSPGSGEYVTQCIYDLTGELNVDALQSAWRNIVERHDNLRTAFFWTGLAEPVQVVLKNVDLAVESEDWSELSGDAQEARFAQLLRRDAEAGFDLSRAPLMRFQWVRLASNRSRLLWTHNHLLLDGWCIPVLFGEVLAFYRANLRGQRHEMPRPRPYREYIRWLQRQDMAKAETYWRAALAGFDSPTPLPGAGLPEMSGREDAELFREQSFVLEADLSDAIRAFAQQNQLTLNVPMQGVWALLLARYSGRDDVMFGATVSGRPPSLPGFETMLGLFINTLPVRARLGDGQLPVAGWLQALQEEQAERSEYEYSPLSVVQGWSDVPAGLPLFDSLFVFENYPADRLPDGKAAGVDEAERIGIERARVRERTNYPITVVVAPGNGVVVSFKYRSDRYSDEAVERLCTHFRVLLSQIAVSPDARLSDLTLLSDAERRRLLVEFNNTRVEYPADMCIHRLFEEQVEKTPDAVAVVFADQALTYSELNARSNRLAHYLQAQGVGPESRVGLLVERSPDMLVGIFGILKAGAAYVPLDPAYPQERIAFMIADSGAKIVVTQETLAAAASASRANPSTVTSSHNLAYVIYTSGSTGIPKGVAIAHRSTVALIFWAQEQFEPSELARVAAGTSVCFDLSVFEIFVPLSCGGTVAIVSNALELAESPDVHGVTLINTVPSAIAELLRRNAVPASVRAVNLAGEPLSAHLADQLYALPHLGKVRDLYGPSEDTTYSTWALRRPGGPETIGVPIDNTQAYILDSAMEPVPVGMPGELYLAGDGLARGYLNRPSLTAEKFVPNPFAETIVGHSHPHFAETNGERLYRTGDLASYLPDGNIEFMGRIDHQVKIRGFRIELGEIESALLQDSAVGAAVVTAREDVPGDKRLTAYVVPNSEQPVNVAELRARLKVRMPDYMVPSAFVMLTALPLTANGKIDRKALPAPEQDGSAAVSEAPRTPAEELLAQIWASVLRRENIGRQENFFDLGGHSLLATQAVSRIRAAFATDLPLRALFEAPTVAELSERIDTMRRESSGLLAPPIVPADRARPLPLSFAQQRLWFIDQLEPGSTVYNIPIGVKLTGPLDTRALEQAIDEIVRRHEPLRTTFGMAGDQPVQIIHPHSPYVLEVVNLEHLPPAEREAETRRMAEEEAVRLFDLSMGPLFRLRLLRLSPEEHTALLTMHHIVSDAWSMGLLVKEIAALYTAYSADAPSPLADLPVQYADFAVWQREWLQGEVLGKQLSYWKARLANIPTLELPTDNPRPIMPTYRGDNVPFHLSAETAHTLAGVSRREGATLFMTLLAAWQVLLARYSGQEDIVVGSPIAGRNRAETEDLIGFFLNTLVLRSDLSGNPSFAELLGRVRSVCLAAYAHQDIPFEQLVVETAPARDLSRHPLFQVAIILQNAQSDTLSLPNLTMSTLAGNRHTAKFDLTLETTQTNEGLNGRLEYATDLFDAATIERMRGHFENLLSQVVASPDARLGDLSLLSDAERNQLIVEFNDTRAEYPADECVHELFEAQAADMPDAVAVVFEDGSLTYGALNAQANRLAHYLRAQNAGPETRVGLLVERSLDMAVGLLGILKAGAAYVPLDPEYPQERLEFTLEDAAVETIVTHRRLLPRISSSRATAVCLDSDGDAIARYDTNNAAADAKRDNPAYTIYTSGSTGKPKGVSITHGDLRSFLFAMSERLPLGKHDTLVAVTTISFDIAGLEFYLPWTVGARVVVASRETALDGVRLAAGLDAYGATMLQATPATWQMLLDAGWQGRPSLTMLCGGEALSAVLARKLVDRGAELWNMYGPTETTIWSMMHPVSDPEASYTSIGRPIANTAVYVADDALTPCPIGVPGELYIGGAGVARGYLNRAALTAEKFVPNPFSDTPGERLYRTGDLARWRAGGDMEFLGRIDHQVKIRGFRIELGEIETTLAAHPSIGAAVVLAREDAPGEKRLVAYLIPDAEQPVDISELRAHLKTRLPEYMIPAAFVMLDSFPLTPNGKTDRRSLPMPDAIRLETLAYEPPADFVEEVLAEIWQGLLRIDRVGRHDNFFDLGGHSLMATRVVSHITEQLGVKLNLRDVFAYPTIALLSEVVQDELMLQNADATDDLLRNVEMLASEGHTRS